ncbi:gamma-mobile-trio recombinase GmtY [Methylophilus sp.]|jgi:integrase|uniref:gamma-mobile-trio recombinase GmtY n=2 Tax=Methylophilus sp. TaxID=29541 RepID=UPI004036725C
MPFVTKIHVNYVDCECGQKFKFPALITESGIIISHLRYLSWNSNKSESWRERSIFALRLLIEFINANNSFEKTTELLKAFTLSLVTGTIDYKDMFDKTGLFWRPRKTADANSLLGHITQYTDFLAAQEGHEKSRSNPFKKATSYEERLNWCAYYHKQANVFLNHLSSSHDAKHANKQIRLIQTFESQYIDIEPVIRFPDEHLENLLTVGCLRKDGTTDFQLQAMIFLMSFGGIRKSELFHLYVGDITLHPIRKNEAMIRVYHPEIGESPTSTYKNRMEYLEATTTYTSRTKYRNTERLFSGWKEPLLTSKSGYFEIVFCPPAMAERFLGIWASYLKYQRVEPPKSKPHPFAFTQLNGDPETLKNFQRKYEIAINKIGLKLKKSHGTTEHGHRHAYGYRAKLLGLDPVEMQKAMHHKSALSHLVYTQPTYEEIRQKMDGIK